MKTPHYKKGVRDIVARAREVNPQIGNYVEHKPAGTDHFHVTLSNGTLTLPRQVAHRQEEFPTQVSTEWVAEIANTFEKSASDARNHGGFIENFLNRFRSK